MREFTSLIMQPFYLAPAMAFSVMTLVLLLLPLPKGKVWHEYRKGYPYILAAFLVMLVLTAMHSVTPPTKSDVFSIMILMIAYYQAILFGMGQVKLLEPQSSARIFVVHMIAVGLATAVVIPVYHIGSHLLRNIFFWIYATGYAFLLVYYTRTWNRVWKRVLAQVDHYYDEDMKSRIKWLKRLMIAVMSVGVMALITSIWVELTPLFVMTYTLCYAYFLACIIRFTLTGTFLMKAVDQQGSETSDIHRIQLAEQESTSVSLEEETESVSLRKTARECQLERALEQWVSTKQYAATDLGVDEIARQLGTNYTALTQYFQRHKGVAFRTWRTDLRLEEAKRLLKEEPQLSLNEIMDMVGFNDRGNFYRHFLRKEGCSPSAFRQGIK